MRDIVIVMSDQHSGLKTSLSDEIARTPNIEKLTETGQYFENAYCNFPLCVPSRMSFLTGKHPSELGILDNDVILDDCQETIADKMTRQGYRTILVGRMHFKGENQLHGFTERYVGDITTQFWNLKREDLGAFEGTMNVKGCLNEYGYGTSPVMQFDEAVVRKAVELLKEKNDQPLFMLVGLYGPHFPYCVEKKYFDNYFNQDLKLQDYHLDCFEEYEDMRLKADAGTLQNIRSAYYGMIEKLDQQIEEIHQAARSNHQDCIFIYTSDHGDQIGKRGLFGKKTFYEDSIRIPLIVEDLKKPAEKHLNEVSLLNLHQYLAQQIGLDLKTPGLNNRKPVLVNSLIKKDDRKIVTQAVIYRRYKYVVFEDEERLFNLSLDKDEKNNIISQYPDIAAKLKKSLISSKKAAKNYQKKREELKAIIKEYEKNPKKDWIRYRIKKEATVKPERGDYEKV